MADQNIRDALAVAAMVRLRQSVTVDRLSQSMHLTTDLDHVLVLEKEQKTVQIVEEVLGFMVDRFVSQVRQADRAGAG